MDAQLLLLTMTLGELTALSVASGFSRNPSCIMVCRVFKLLLAFHMNSRFSPIGRKYARLQKLIRPWPAWYTDYLLPAH